MNNIIIHLLAYSNDEGWIDLSPDVISPIKTKHGIFGTKPFDRIADIGTMTFVLNNISEKYTPDYSVQHGWGKNTYLQLWVEYNGSENINKCKWLGRIDKITLNNPINGIPTVNVTAVDGVNDLVNSPLITQEIQYQQTLETAGETLLNKIPAAEDWEWSLYSGKTFPTVFDSTKNTTAYAEFNKLILSELGYLYFRYITGAQNIVGENFVYRTNVDFREIPLHATYSSYILDEESYFLLLETEDKIFIDEATYTNMQNEMISYKIDYGDNMINQFLLKVYPRTIDSASAILFSQQKAIEMAANETKYIKVTYADPRGGSQRVSGSSMITPVATTDYLMYQNSDGTGTNYTANLSVTTVDTNHIAAPFGAWDTILKLTSSVASVAYITKLQCRGTGCYFDNPVEILVSASASMEYYGISQDTLDQKYETDFTSSEVFSTLLLGSEQNPRTVLRSIKFIANTNNTLLSYYLYNEIGDLVHISIDESSVSSAYFINGIETTIDVNGLIITEWTLIESILYSTNFFTLDDAVYGLLDSENVFGF